MFRRSVVAAALAAGMLSAQPAGAVVLVGFLEGTVTSGTDGGGHFGGGDLTGQSFRFDFAWDTANGFIFDQLNPPDPNEDKIQSLLNSGPMPGQLGPVSISVGGTPVLLDGVDNQGLITGWLNPVLPVSGYFVEIGSSGALGALSFHSGFTDFLPLGLFGGYDGAACAVAGCLVANFSLAGGTSGQFDATRLAWTVQGGEGVPEPATWALLITGFGLAGAALRRRPALA